MKNFFALSFSVPHDASTVVKVWIMNDGGGVQGEGPAAMMTNAQDDTFATSQQWWDPLTTSTFFCTIAISPKTSSVVRSRKVEAGNFTSCSARSQHLVVACKPSHSPEPSPAFPSTFRQSAQHWY
jgi:hypothetical protein